MSSPVDAWKIFNNTILFAFIAFVLLFGYTLYEESTYEYDVGGDVVCADKISTWGVEKFTGCTDGRIHSNVAAYEKNKKRGKD